MTMLDERPTETASGLPEGVYKRDGKFYREIKRIRRTPDGLFYEPVEREVALVSPMETDEVEISKARERAAARGVDFYDPRTVDGEVIGWLDRGRKRQKEWKANEGWSYESKKLIPIPDEENPDLANVRTSKKK